MAPTVPSREPTATVAGMTWSWTLASSTYPPSEGWTLSYSIVGPSVLGWDPVWVSTVPSGDYAVTIPATATTGLLPGQYRVMRIWSRGAERYAEHVPRLLVTADPTAPVDSAQSADERALAAVQAAIAARLAGDEPEEYTIGSHSVRRLSLQTLTQLEQRLRAAVWRARTGQAGPPYYVVLGRG